MRRAIRLPRILKINKIDHHSITLTFNNGESRIIDFREVLKSIGVDEHSPAYILFDDKELKKIEA